MLTERATADEEASARRKKRKVEGARYTFTKNCYFTTLQHVSDGAELIGNSYCNCKAMSKLLETLDGTYNHTQPQPALTLPELPGKELLA